MTSPQDRIVDFENPPVAEVGLSVQLQGATLDTQRAIGAFYPTLQERYPRILSQPPAPTLEESFEIPTPPAIAFQLLGGQESQRWVFETEDQTETVQVQHNRFLYAWAKERPEVRYPNYEVIREHFASAYQSYLDAAESEVEGTWCEIFYANPIWKPEGESRPELSTLVTLVAPSQLTGLPTPYNTGFDERFQLERADGTPYARFFIQIQSTVGPPRRLGYTVTLLMRGRPESPDLDGVLAFFDEGRERIVTTFRDITTPERHAEWGVQ